MSFKLHVESKSQTNNSKEGALGDIFEEEYPVILLLSQHLSFYGGIFPIQRALKIFYMELFFE